VQKTKRDTAFAMTSSTAVNELQPRTDPLD